MWKLSYLSNSGALSDDVSGVSNEGLFDDVFWHKPGIHTNVGVLVFWNVLSV